MLMVPICFLLIIHAYNQLRRDEKAPPSISASVCSSVSFNFSVFFFLLFIM